MATVTGKPAVKDYMAQAPVLIAGKLARGAARAGAKVILDEARQRVISQVVRGALVMRTTVEPNRVVVRITIRKGWPLSVATWLEYGTTAHFISVDENHRKGRSARRINRLDRLAREEGRTGPGESLVIKRKFVGDTVHHPGAKPHPFLRVSLDLKGEDAVAAAQSYINARTGGASLASLPDDEGDQ